MIGGVNTNAGGKTPLNGDSENDGPILKEHPPVLDWPRGESTTFPALLERVDFHDGEMRFPPRIGWEA